LIKRLTIDLISAPEVPAAQTRLAQTLGNALKLGKENDDIGPSRPILQPKGDGVIGPKPTKLGDDGVSFTFMSRQCVSGGEIRIGTRLWTPCRLEGCI
jgi:hypothetical protein